MGLKRRPGRFATTVALDALFARGWPYLRVLTDETVDKPTARATAKKALQAIDPLLSTHVPRDVARRYLLGYIVRDPYKDKDQLKQALADDETPVTRELLRAILDRKLGPSPHAGYGGETYDFRLAEIMFLFEAFLGTPTVVAALVDHLVAAREHPAWWGDEFFRDHDHAEARRLVPVLGWMRLRMDPTAWRAAIAPLAGDQPALPGFVDDLATLIDDAHPIDDIANPAWIAMQRRDKAWLLTHLQSMAEFGYWTDPQLYYVVGAEALDSQSVAKLTRLAKWQQLRLIDEFGVMRAPQVVRVIRALLDSRSAGEAAAQWLAARGVSSGGAAPVRTAAELKAELASMFAMAGTQLRAQGGDRDKELALLRGMFERHCEIRAALDDPIPEAYFTHKLADASETWDDDEDTIGRWFDLAIEAASS